MAESGEPVGRDRSDLVSTAPSGEIYRLTCTCQQRAFYGRVAWSKTLRASEHERLSLRDEPLSARASGFADVGRRGIPNSRDCILHQYVAISNVPACRLCDPTDVGSVVWIEGLERGSVKGLKRAEQGAER